MEQSGLHRPKLSPKENFLLETPRGAMWSFGYSELPQGRNEALGHYWLKSKTPPKKTCPLSPAFSTAQPPRPVLQGMRLTKMPLLFPPFQPPSRQHSTQPRPPKTALQAPLLHTIHRADLCSWSHRRRPGPLAENNHKSCTKSKDPCVEAQKARQFQQILTSLKLQRIQQPPGSRQTEHPNHFAPRAPASPRKPPPQGSRPPGEQGRKAKPKAHGG